MKRKSPPAPPPPVPPKTPRARRKRPVEPVADSPKPKRGRRPAVTAAATAPAATAPEPIAATPAAPAAEPIAARPYIPRQLSELSPEERAELDREVAIQREIIRHKREMADPAFKAKAAMKANRAEFCRRSLVVEDNRGQLVPYEYKPAQALLDERIDAIRAAGKPPRIIILKKRRGGFSTGVAGRFFTETAFTPGQSTLIVAHELLAVQDSIYPMYKRFAEKYRPFTVKDEHNRIISRLPQPKITSNNSRGLEWANGSSLHIATAKNVQSGRGFNFRRVHFSEAAFYSDFKTLMAAVMATVPADLNTAVIVESTANGVGGHFYDLCKEAQDPQGNSEWTFIFFGCFDDPTSTMPLPATIDPAAFQESLGSDPAFNAYEGEELELQRQYNLRPEQLYWRRWTITNVCQKSIDVFNQEYPHSPEVAFLTSGRPRFNHTAIGRFKAQPGLIGSLELQRVGLKEIVVFNGLLSLPGQRAMGPLEVWRRPERGRQYVIGADTAEGIDRSGNETGGGDPDYSVAQVLDLETGEQQARFRDRCYESLFGQQVAYLAWWYNAAYVVPEVVRGYGRAMLDAMLATGYPMDRIYHRRNPMDSNSRSYLPRYDDLGYDTNTVTRPQLVGNLDMAILEHSIELYDAITITELQEFVIKKTGKAEGMKHDDTVMSLALAVIGLLSAPRGVLADLLDVDQPDQPATRHYSVSMRQRVLEGMPSVYTSEDQPADWAFKRRLLG